MLAGRGLRDGLITHPEHPTECGVSEFDREALIMRPLPIGGCWAMGKVSFATV